MLTPDQVSVFTRAKNRIVEMLEAASLYASDVDKNRDVLNDVASLMRHNTDELLQIIDPNKAAEKRQVDDLADHIKTLNQEIKDLNSQLASAGDLKFIAPKLKQSVELLLEWLNTLGFGCYKELYFKNHNAVGVVACVELYPFISSGSLDFTDTPSTNKIEFDNKIEKLGENVDVFQYNNSVHFRDTDKTKDGFKKLIQERFPNYQVIEFESGEQVWNEVRGRKISAIKFQVPVSDCFQ